VKAFILTSILLFGANQAYAGLYLNVSILHHKGIDKGITLLSEYHSKEEVPPQKKLRIKMREGVELQLLIDFKGEESLYGPSSLLQIGGKIFAENGKEFADLGNESTVHVGKELNFSVKDQAGQLIEVTVVPQFR